MAHHGAHLSERLWIKEEFDALARCPPAALMLPDGGGFLAPPPLLMMAA
jgi:hypothetical protein